VFVSCVVIHRLLLQLASKGFIGSGRGGRRECRVG
jgi:hypothetical protein